MSGSEFGPAGTRNEDIAVRWIVKRDSDDWSVEDRDAFESWLAESTANRLAYLRMAAAWTQAARLAALRTPNGSEMPPPRRGCHPDDAAGTTPSEPAAPPRRSTRALRLGTILCALLVALLAVYFESLAPGDFYSTPIGAMEFVQLSDGSRLILNTDTRLTVKLSARERRVHLERGEAMFEVAKDAGRPFIVDADRAGVRAVGTEFAVRRGDDELRVVVMQGRVRFSTPAHEWQIQREMMPRNPGSTHEIELAAGAIVRARKAVLTIDTDAGTEAQRLLSWRRGYVEFDDTPLGEAVAEFNRYNKRKILIADPAIRALRIGGNFRTNNIDGFVWLLERGFPVSARREGDLLVLHERH